MTAADTTTQVAYLGPEGTFCHEAALSQDDLASKTLIAKRSIADVFESVDQGESVLGVVPLENTIEGSVDLTLDMLIFDSEAMVQREIDHNISLCLAAKQATDLNKVSTVLSHPHALAQCRTYLDSKLEEVMRKATDSTASAAHFVSQSPDETVAAICPVEAAKSFGLKVLDAKIQDREFNQTRFIVIGTGIPAPSARNKTSIVCFQRANQPGSLLNILSEFADRGIDLTKLESRPTKEGLGQYCFIMDFVGHISDDNVSECLENVRTNHADVKFLGSYPVAGDAQTQNGNGTPRIWKETKQWLKDLKEKISEA